MKIYDEQWKIGKINILHSLPNSPQQQFHTDVARENQSNAPRNERNLGDTETEL